MQVEVLQQVLFGTAGVMQQGDHGEEFAVAGAAGSHDWNFALVFQDDKTAAKILCPALMGSKSSVEVASRFLRIGRCLRRSAENLAAPGTSPAGGNPITTLSQVRQRPVGHRRSLGGFAGVRGDPGHTAV